MDLLEHLVELRRRGQPVAMATVVAIRAPASARPGDRALVLASGELVGWVGASCAQPAVQREALRALADGRPRLVRLTPDAGGIGPAEGVVEDVMACQSGGAIEVYVEPFLPRPHLVVAGDSPIAEALSTLGTLAEFRVTRDIPTTAEEAGAGDRYVVVAGMGADDEADLERALQLEPTYLAIVGSRRRRDALVDSLTDRGLPPDQLARIVAPAGLDIGASTAPEIAISIIAQIVAHRRGRADQPRPEPTPQIQPATATTSPLPEAIDPVCGMRVAILGARHTLDHDDQTFYFCCPSCKRTFAATPERYLTSKADPPA